MNYLTTHKHREPNYLRAYKAPTEPQILSREMILRAYKAPILCRLSSVVCPLSSVFCPLHLSRELYKSPLFMQNKPKVKIGKMNITSFNRMDYENKSNWTLGKSGKNKAKQTQTKPNKAKVKIGKMNITSFITMNYEQRTKNDEKNKANQTQTNPIQSQYKLEAKRSSLWVSFLESSNRGPNKPNPARPLLPLY